MPGSTSRLAQYLKSSKKSDVERTAEAASDAQPSPDTSEIEALQSCDEVLDVGTRDDDVRDHDVQDDDVRDHETRDHGAAEVAVDSESDPEEQAAPQIGGRGVPAGIAVRTGTGHAEDNATPAVKSRNAATERDDSKSRVEELLSRVEKLVGPEKTGFEPRSPGSIAATGLTAEEIEKLVLKMLNSRGSASGRQIAVQTCLPFPIIETILKGLRAESLVALKGAAEAGDYDFVLTEGGRTRAAEYIRDCSYFGAAPVCLADYLSAMAAQSIAKQEISEPDLKRAFADLIISPSMLDRLGPAVNSGRGMFLFGEPGNGKTSIAERITAAFSSHIWIPRALGIDGEILRLFDPGVHEIVKEEESDSLIDLTGIDHRWVRIVRPTVIVGGELTMDELEVTQNPVTRICESPVQLKSNCGTLVIDDFGRQRMPVDELLNRWIVPLEKRYDFLNLPSGKKIQVPFDQLIIFSTNLEPNELVDGAFLRRIPYNIQVPDPTTDEFRAIFDAVAPYMGFENDSAVVEYVIKHHYERVDRPYRSCHVRDLLLQVRNYCTYRGLPRKMSNEAMDFAVENYFSVL